MHKPLPSVFVVDPELLIASTWSEILRKNGFSATYFTDAQEALAAARQEPPDLLLSELSLSGLSGIDLAIAIRQRCPQCKVMLFSSRAETLILLSKAREQGHDFPVMTKPIHPTELLHRIHQKNQAWAIEH